jgi:O-antigen ligase
LVLRLARWALALTVAAAPLYVIRWRAGPVPTTLLENLELITIALYIAVVVTGRKPFPFRTPLDIPLALFVIAALIGIAVAPDHRGALGIVRAYVIEPVAMFYVAIALLQSAVAMDTLLAVGAAGAIAFSGLEIATLARALVTNSLNPSFAPAAFGINANSVALYLEPLVGLASGIALFGHGRYRATAVVTLLFLLPADLATLSRGGLLALGMLALIAIVSVRAPRVRIGLIAAAAAGVAGALTLPVISSRVLGGFDPVWGTFAERGRIWVATVRMLRDHPIFGAGVNAYQTVMAPYRAADRYLIPEPYPHNIFLTSWTETGVLGLAAFAWILGALIIQPWRAFRQATGLHRALLWGTGAAFAMVLVHGLVDSPYWKNDLSLEFWVIAAVGVVSRQIVYNISPPR